MDKNNKRKRDDNIYYNTDEFNLHITGYTVFREAIKVDDKIMEELNNQVDKKAGIIFNHNTEKKNDKKRVQCNLSTKKPFIKTFINNITNFINKNIGNDNLTINDWVILKSKKGCQKQAAHSDYVPDKTFKKAMEMSSKDIIPLLILISLEPETYIYVWNKSINLITKTEEEFKESQKIYSTKVLLNKGDILVFRADCIHAGADFDKDNIRLHCYLDSTYVPRTPNRTWLIHTHGNDKLKEIISP